jgi:hypothetical protein
MSLYTVTSIPLAAIPGVHSGTGTHQNSNWLVVPSSVPGRGKLQFNGAWVQVTTMLFQLNANVVPNWIGVAIPNGIQDFTKAHIFFHPMPAQAGYKDSDYPTKAGMWPQLFYYMERLGYQLDGAARNQIIIMPFLTNAATDTGIFAANWTDICTDILTTVRSALGADDGSTLQISQIAVSSYSVGIVYSANFRAHAPNLNLMTEVWDFDGLFSSTPSLSQALVTTTQYTAIKYDQNPASGAASYHVPLARWSDYVAPPATSLDVHALIRDFMFLHAASISNVGGTIAGGLGPTGSSGSPGSSGTPGTPPTSGIMGTTGTTGTPGSSGTSGSPGGTTGTTGSSGSSGASGQSGTTGTTGSSGTTGTTGTTGTAGTTGATGTTGASGTTETSGSTGSPLAPPFSPSQPPPHGPMAPPNAPRLPPSPPPVYHPMPPLGPMPIAPRQPGKPPQPPSPSTPPAVQAPPSGGCECECCTAIAAMVSNVAITANTAIIAITAIATRGKKGH